MGRTGAGSQRRRTQQKPDAEKPDTKPEPRPGTQPDGDWRDDRSPFRNRYDGDRFLAPLSTIAPNPRNVREDWEWEDDPEFDDFVGNIETLGQLQDPTVIARSLFAKEFPDDASQLTDDIEWVIGTGERRYRAAVRLKQEELAVVLANANVYRMDEVLWSENQSRKGLDPIQEGILFTRLRKGRGEVKGMTLEQISKKLGSRGGKKLSIGEISKKIRLAALPDGPVRRAVRRRELGVEPAYLLLTQLKSPERIEKGLALMEEQGITAEKALTILNPPPRRDRASASGDVSSSSRKRENVQADSAETTIPPQADGARPSQDGTAPAAATPSPDAGAAAQAREAALRRLVAQHIYAEPDAVTLRLAAAVVAHADVNTVGVAQDLLAAAGHPVEKPWEGRRLVQVADSIVIAAHEIRAFEHTGTDAWDDQDAAYVSRLVDEAGYVPSAWETEHSPALAAAQK